MIGRSRSFWVDTSEESFQDRSGDIVRVGIISKADGTNNTPVRSKVHSEHVRDEDSHKSSMVLKYRNSSEVSCRGQHYFNWLNGPPLKLFRINMYTCNKFRSVGRK